MRKLPKNENQAETKKVFPANFASLHFFTKKTRIVSDNIWEDNFFTIQDIFFQMSPFVDLKSAANISMINAKFLSSIRIFYDISGQPLAVSYKGFFWMTAMG